MDAWYSFRSDMFQSILVWGTEYSKKKHVNMRIHCGGEVAPKVLEFAALRAGLAALLEIVAVTRCVSTCGLCERASPGTRMVLTARNTNSSPFGSTSL